MKNVTITVVNDSHSLSERKRSVSSVTRAKRQCHGSVEVQASEERETLSSFETQKNKNDPYDEGAGYKQEDKQSIHVLVPPTSQREQEITQEQDQEQAQAHSDFQQQKQERKRRLLRQQQSLSSPSSPSSPDSSLLVTQMCEHASDMLLRMIDNPFISCTTNNARAIIANSPSPRGFKLAASAIGTAATADCSNVVACCNSKSFFDNNDEKTTNRDLTIDTTGTPSGSNDDITRVISNVSSHTSSKHSQEFSLSKILSFSSLWRKTLNNKSNQCNKITSPNTTREKTRDKMSAHDSIIKNPHHYNKDYDEIVIQYQPDSYVDISDKYDIDDENTIITRKSTPPDDELINDDNNKDDENTTTKGTVCCCCGRILLRILFCKKM